jgi:Ni/Fe-hydrogenase 1 B-type cytochrome subunit
MFERVRVWEAPVRLLHWIHVASGGVLVLTGYYIGHPFIQAASAGQPYLMGWVRLIHFSAAFVFTFGFVIRSYWFVRGNEFESWRAWLPTSRKRWRELWLQLKYYLFLQPERPNYVGLNPMAGLTYLIVGVLIVVQILTGFALFSLPFRSGVWPRAFGWLVTNFGAQPLRLVHHILLWVFVAFFILHLYLAVLDDLEERKGEILSMISGDKFEEPEDVRRRAPVEKRPNAEGQPT